ncbi:hypothetical protein H2203_003357 [Taxawa tesnikishii (nom. ined.)]|nr:hypothetical protein H2203_003357 [Dothideales sp. JES 119]
MSLASSPFLSDFSISPIASPHASDPVIVEDVIADNQAVLEEGERGLPEDYDTDREQNVEAILHHDLDDEVRPNRFTGTTRSWRRYTENERGVAGYLDQVRAEDLSVHLYNAHAFKAGLRQLSEDVKPWHGKSKWIRKDEDGKIPWYPDKQWTAWPLESDVVPRGDESFGTGKDDGLDKYTVKRKEEWKPSQGLEEEIRALLERRIKEQWETREWEEEEKKLMVEKPVVERSPSTSRPSRSRSTSRAPSRSRSATPYAGSSRRSSAQPAGTDQATKEEGPEDDNHEGPVAEELDSYSLPVFCADEERTRQLLQPTVRHMLSKFDDLLVALHNNREGHYVNRDQSDESGASGTESGSRSRSASARHRQSSKMNKLKRSTRSSKSAGTGENAVAAENGDHVEQRQAHPRTSRSRSNSQSSIHSSASGTSGEWYDRTGLRDWSEVLGLAAMTGWDSEVIERATQRCTALFGEGMTFRKIPEFASNKAKKGLKIVEYKPDTIPPLGALAEVEESSADEVDQPQNLAGYVCPHELCPRHIKPFDKGFRFREHLRRAHGYSNEEIEEVENDMEQRGGRPLGKGHNPRGWQPPDPLKCPHTDCRSGATVFPEPRRLIEHLKRTHKYDPRTQPPPASVRLSSRRPSTDDAALASETPGARQESEDEMVGGVHNDGFMCTIAAIQGARGKDSEKRAVREKSVPKPESTRKKRRRTD